MNCIFHFVCSALWGYACDPFSPSDPCWRDATERVMPPFFLLSVRVVLSQARKFSCIFHPLSLRVIVCLVFFLLLLHVDLLIHECLCVKGEKAGSWWLRWKSFLSFGAETHQKRPHRPLVELNSLRQVFLFNKWTAKAECCTQIQSKSYTQ